MKETKYELLLAIANQGYTEQIMDAARAQGAGGGTVIHAKGTGMEHAEQFLGFSLASEKEIVLIVVPHEKKNAIMRAIMDQAGLTSDAKAVVFSLPVTSTAGMRLMEMEEATGLGGVVGVVGVVLSPPAVGCFVPQLGQKLYAPPRYSPQLMQ